jgi:hypothetical protein
MNFQFAGTGILPLVGLNSKDPTAIRLKDIYRMASHRVQHVLTIHEEMAAPTVTKGADLR